MGGKLPGVRGRGPVFHPHPCPPPIVFGTNFAGEAQERYGYTGGAFLYHLSLGEGDTNGLLCTCARDSTKPPRLTVFSSTGAVVRPSACGWYHAGSGREQAVVLWPVRDLAAFILFQPDRDELAGPATADHLRARAGPIRHPTDLAGRAE